MVSPSTTRSTVASWPGPISSGAAEPAPWLHPPRNNATAKAAAPETARRRLRHDDGLGSGSELTLVERSQGAAGCLDALAPDGLGALVNVPVGNLVLGKCEAVLHKTHCVEGV